MASTPTLDRLDQDLNKRVSAAQEEIVSVTFSATAHADTDIRHALKPPTPEHVDYKVLRASGPVSVYHDASASRKAWSAGVIVLRCNVASAKVDLLLSVSQTKRTLTEGGSSDVNGSNIIALNAGNISSGLLALARGGSGADLSATGAAGPPAHYAKQAGVGAALTVGAIVAADLPTHEHAASAITSGALVLERGGTEADLGATGPGLLKQATLGAAVTVAPLLVGEGKNIVAVSVTPANNTGAAESDMQSITIPAGTLAAAGESLIIFAAGTSQNAGNNHLPRLYFGATVLLAHANYTTAVDWNAIAIVSRVDATNQIASAFGFRGVAATAYDTTSPGETLANAVTVKTTGDGDGDGDITSSLLLAFLVR